MKWIQLAQRQMLRITSCSYEGRIIIFLSTSPLTSDMEQDKMKLSLEASRMGTKNK